MIHPYEICIACIPHPARYLLSFWLLIHVCIFLVADTLWAIRACLCMQIQACIWVMWQSVCRRDRRIKASSTIFSISGASSSTFNHTSIGVLSILLTTLTGSDALILPPVNPGTAQLLKLNIH